MKTPITQTASFSYIENLILVPTVFEGKSHFDMVLDSGADPGDVDISVVRSILGKESTMSRYPAKNTTTGQTINYYCVNFNKIETGNHKTSNALFLVKEYEQGQKQVGGILGASYLKDKIIQIDYVKQNLYFFEQSPIPEIEKGKDSQVFLMLISENAQIPRIELVINEKPIKALIDTGFMQKVVVTPLAIEYLELREDEIKQEFNPGCTANGETNRWKGALDNIRFGTEILKLRVSDRLCK